MSVNLGELIHKGGVYKDVAGNSPAEIYKNIIFQMKFEKRVTPELVYEAVCSREELMSTAVGHGIALPHARIPVIRAEDDQRVCVIYLKNPIQMNAPDDRKVYVMFMILTQNQRTHLEILSKLVCLFQDVKFKKLLENHGSEAELLNGILNLA